MKMRPRDKDLLQRIARNNGKDKKITEGDIVFPGGEDSFSHRALLSLRRLRNAEFVLTDKGPIPHGIDERGIHITPHGKDFLRRSAPLNGGQ